ncbi:protein translocase subunit SecF [Deltaproteobacteria bacterium PRO3]|nr:protein translocase subunit SecF [Deltaproteobacteria bacterium PRO3]
MTRLKKEIPFMKYRWLMLIVSMAIVAAGLAAVAVKGLNFGTDFTGGLKFIYQFQNSVNEGALTDALRQAGLSHVVVQRFGEAKANTFIVKSEQIEGLEEGFSRPFNQAFEKTFGAGSFQMLQEEFVGPKVGKELRTKGLYAVLWAWVIMLIYIGFRFDFYFAPGAIIALIHDVLVAVGIFALLGLEVNLTVVAAILTIIGYSINDTIIVFDRIREDLQKHKGMGLVEVVNKSINETLSRTIITSLTVFFVVTVLYFRTDGDIKNFAFAMMIGVITGSYSSISIASPVFIFLKQHGHRFGLGKGAAGAKA